MIAKTQQELDELREAGRRMAIVVRAVLGKVAPGVSSMELEETARAVTRAQEASPSYLGFKPKGEERAYPAALCVSINDEIAHAIPRKEKILTAGDIVSIDFGLSYRGRFMDTAHTLAVGKSDAKGANLLAGTACALERAIEAAQVGGRVGDISAMVEATAKEYRLGVVKDLRGHGVGAAVHEAPNIPNFGKAGQGEELVEGMVLALEPIFAERSGALEDGNDGYGYVTRDRSRAAHFEHTILLTKNGPEILTAL